MRAQAVFAGPLVAAVVTASTLGAGALVGTFTEVEPAVPGGYVTGNDINDAGQSVGSAEFAGGSRAFRREADGTMTELAPLPGDSFSGASAINEAGDVVGGSDGQATWWEDGGSPVPLGNLPGSTDSVASDINDDGWIIGTTSDTGQSWYWDPDVGVMTDLGTVPGGTNVQARAINNNEVVVGRVLVAGDFEPFIWTEAEGMSLLPVPPGEDDFEPSDIIDSNLIIGFSFELVDAEGVYRAYVLSTLGTFEELTVDGYQSAFPRGMSEAGLVVGFVDNPGSSSRTPAAWDLVTDDATAFPLFVDDAFTNELNAVNVDGVAVGISREGDDFDRTFIGPITPDPAPPAPPAPSPDPTSPAAQPVAAAPTFTG
jgi:uncharacterized membrane protein